MDLVTLLYLTMWQQVKCLHRFLWHSVYSSSTMATMNINFAVKMHEDLYQTTLDDN